MAVEMRHDLALTDDQLPLLADACTHHTDGRIEAARDPELMDWTQQRAESDHVPSMVVEHSEL